MKFNIAHIVPSRKAHGLHGYREVIDSVIWGLEALGHEASYGLNHFDPDARNIVFGGQMLPVETQKTLRPDTIVYNFEQMRGVDVATIRPEMQHFAAHFEVWDYSGANIESWAGRTKYPVKLVPVGFAPVLERIPRAPDQDIDALIYGLPGDLRLAAFGALGKAGLRSVFVSGLYGEARDALISRARTIVNVTLYRQSKIFEVVRASYLFANRKALVAHVEPETVVEPDLLSAFHLTTSRALVADVGRLAEDDNARHKLEERAYDTFRRRDIRQILAAALG